MGEFVWRSHGFQENKKESSEGSGRLIVTRSKFSYPSPPPTPQAIIRTGST